MSSQHPSSFNRHWSGNPSAVEQLAAAYVAGTLRGRARRRFEAEMQRKPMLVDSVNEWTARLGALHTSLPPVSPSPQLWDRIAQANGVVAAGARGTQPLPASRPAASWWQRLFSPIPATALAMGLVLGSVLPAVWRAQTSDHPNMELPASYVGVLATPDGQPGLIISSLRRGTVVDVKRETPVSIPPGQTLFLWRIDQAGQVQPVGPLPDGKFVHVTLDAPAEEVFKPAVELAVSLEPQGEAPAQPTQPFVYRGLCGKIWP
ncbi:anti-sigma factor [Hydrogenophaga sp. 5NK40-0174]|uniref:anti-sigma factor n=1 Tax=Hydrogenophaga sp. 5NK40-0174 TaxID=3127649 RepID=UPI00310624A0